MFHGALLKHSGSDTGFVQGATALASSGSAQKVSDPSQITRPFKELADAMAPESRARAGAKAAELSQTTDTPRHPGACEGCDTLEICVEQDECWVDHRSLFRMAEHLATKKGKSDV